MVVLGYAAVSHYFLHQFYISSCISILCSNLLCSSTSDSTTIFCTTTYIVLCITVCINILHYNLR